MKCIRYGLYGQVPFKNGRAILFFDVRKHGRKHGLHLVNEGGCAQGIKSLFTCDILSFKYLNLSNKNFIHKHDLQINMAKSSGVIYHPWKH